MPVVAFSWCVCTPLNGKRALHFIPTQLCAVILVSSETTHHKSLVYEGEETDHDEPLLNDR